MSVEMAAISALASQTSGKNLEAAIVLLQQSILSQVENVPTAGNLQNMTKERALGVKAQI